jgi:hypothetical protein
MYTEDDKGRREGKAAGNEEKKKSREQHEI